MAGVGQQFSGHVSVTGKGGGMSRRARRRLAFRLERMNGLRGSGLMVVAHGGCGCRANAAEFITTEFIYIYHRYLSIDVIPGNQVTSVTSYSYAFVNV